MSFGGSPQGLEEQRMRKGAHVKGEGLYGKGAGKDQWGELGVRVVISFISSFLSGFQFMF